MKALLITQQGTPVADNVRLIEDFQDPDAQGGPPAPGSARVRTLCSALNHLDLWMGRGLPGWDLAWPMVSGADCCGVVEAVGPGVDESWAGRRVILNAALAEPIPEHPDHPPASSFAPVVHLLGEGRPGVHRETFDVPVANLAAVPDSIDPTHAAAFGLTFLTAYSMLVTKAALRPGQSVLITGIGGGVALASLAIAKHLGCPVCVTSRHRWKLDKAQGLGADHAVLDEGEDWSRPVRDWSLGRGVDLAVDSSGKATHLNCVKALARGGAYVTPGCTSGPDATTDLARVFWNQLRLLGSTMGTNAEFREVTALFAAGALVPVIDSVHSAERGTYAFARLESAEQFGKIVIDWR